MTTFDLCAWLEANGATLLIDAALTALLFYPICKFLWSGWQRRRDEIMGSLNVEAKRSYLAIFRKHDPTNNLGMSDGSAKEKFDALYLSEYGRQNFIIPIGLLVLVVAVENFFLAKALPGLMTGAIKPDTFDIAAAAVAGAYTFVCWDLFARMQQRTLSQAIVLRSTLRLAVAVPIAVAFASLIGKFAVFIAFGIGAFPLQGISILLQRQVKKYLSLEPSVATAPKKDAASNGTTSTTSRDQVFELAGIDTAIAERIEDADITTITQLAWADPVQLTMRTNLQFAFVLDIVSQALAWVYLEDKLKPLGVVGLRGAVEIRSALDDLAIRKIYVKDPDEASSVEEPDKKLRREERTREAAASAIVQGAKLVGVSEDAFLYGLIQVGNDPTADFLCLSFKSLTEARRDSRK